MKIECINSLGEKITLGNAFPFFLQSAEGLGDIKNTYPSSKAAGQNGSTYSTGTVDERNIVLTVQIHSNYNENHDALRDFFQCNDAGTLIYYGASTPRKIEYVPESVTVPSTGTVRRVSISLLCGDPFFYDLDETQVQLSTLQGKIHFPLNIKNPFTVTDRIRTLMKNIYNASNTELGLRIRFQASGEVVNPSITDVNRQLLLQVGTTAAPITMHDGDTLEVTTGKSKKQAILTRADGTVLNVINAIAYPPQWITLKRGDNLIKYDAQSGLEVLSCDIFYRNLYRGCI